MRLCWLSFGKFIKSQCQKGRAVDTQIVGLFVPSSLEQETLGAGNDSVTFLPSPEYLAAGSFKLPRHLQSACSNKGQTYKEYYEDLRQRLNSSTSSLNFKALASAVEQSLHSKKASNESITSEFMKQSLIDVFEKLR